MTDNGASYPGTTRIHAVILTRDRPEALERCINTALSTLGAEDTLTVLDDSCAMISHANAAALAQAAWRSTAHLTHVRAEQLHEVIVRAMGGQGALWQSRTAPRDIAPLRNLTLLISAAVGAQTTVLVDDDICHFDFEATHRMLDAHYRASGAALLGAEIGGTTEQDTVTRLSDAIGLLQSKIDSFSVPAEALFRVQPDSDSRRADPCGWLSGGYMAFRLPTTSLFAFPPGYNEDWLWSLLHAAGGEARLLRVDQAVLHEPPVLRRSTRDDILFELAGDLIFDCLVAYRDGRARRPESALEDLADRAPDPSVMPAVRAETVLKQARGLSENGHRGTLADLESYGLSVLRNMLRSGELEMDGSRRLRDWSADAVAKQRSFATTLETVTTSCALRTALKEGGK